MHLPSNPSANKIEHVKSKSASRLELEMVNMQLEEQLKK